MKRKSLWKTNSTVQQESFASWQLATPQFQKYVFVQNKKFQRWNILCSFTWPCMEFWLHTSRLHRLRLESNRPYLGGLSLGENWPEREANHSYPSGDEDKKARRYTSTHVAQVVMNSLPCDCGLIARSQCLSLWYFLSVTATRRGGQVFRFSMTSFYQYRKLTMTHCLITSRLQRELVALLVLSNVLKWISLLRHFA